MRANHQILCVDRVSHYIQSYYQIISDRTSPSGGALHIYLMLQMDPEPTDVFYIKVHVRQAIIDYSTVR
jgi:hypothetical protein